MNKQATTLPIRCFRQRHFMNKWGAWASISTLILAVLLVVGFTEEVTAQAQRTWQSVDGKTMAGRLFKVGLNGNKQLSTITVLDNGNAIREIPMHLLSLADKEYVDAHTWISSEGAITVGELTDVIKTGNQEIAGAEIRLPSGNTIKVPLAKLSLGDKEFLRKASEFDLKWGIPRQHSLVEDFERLRVGVKNQGRRGSCTVFGSLAVIEYHMARRGNFVSLSEQFAAWAATKIEDYRRKEGYSMWDVTQGIQKYGITTEELMPYSESVVGRPSNEALVDAATRKNIAALIFKDDPECRRDGFSIDVIRTLCGSIAEGWPVTVGMRWSDGGLDRYNMLEERGVSSNDGHVIVLVGYTRDDRIPGGGKFTFRNSWGRDYGQNGYADVSFRYLLKYGGGAFAIRLF